MFGKVMIFASTAGVALSAPAVTRSVADVLKLQSVKPTESKVTSSTIDMSAAVTSGAMAEETHLSASCGSSQPMVDGYVLGACSPSILGGGAWKYASCEWNSDMSQLSYNYLTYSTNDCSGTATSDQNLVVTGLTNGCSSSGTYKYQCGSSVSWSDYGSPQHAEIYNSRSCGGSAVEWQILSYADCTDDSSCTPSSISDSTWATKGICDDSDDICFHVDSKINYKGVEYTYQELKDGKEPECTVPHSPRSRGVVISTSCDKTVRVTDTHLLATTKGFRLAYSLKPGDVMYGDYDKELCTVKSVEKEKETQQYFGLNCVHSEVLASGLRASTFGDFHTLPSWYMTYVGGIVGTEAAGSLGEYIAEWINQ